MRALQFLRKSMRKNVLSQSAEPDRDRNTTKRKKMTGSYAELLNLPVSGTYELQDPVTGKLKWLMDYDPLP